MQQPQQQQGTTPRTTPRDSGAGPGRGAGRGGSSPYDPSRVQGEYGAPSGPDRSGGRRNDKGYRDNHNRLRALVKEFRAANEGLEIGYVQLKNEVQHYQSRLLRIEETHKLEVARLRKEVDYHKRLRAGAEQRAYDLEDRLRSTQRQAAGFDEAQSSLIEQSQLLVSKNAELTLKLKTSEAQVTQLADLKSCLERELEDVYADRDKLVAELEKLYLERNAAHLLPSQQPLGGLPEDEYEYEEDEDLGAGGGAEAGEGGSGEGTLEPSTS